jgi:DNA-binding response OmpR family regulator
MPDENAENGNAEEGCLKFGHLFIDVFAKNVKIKDKAISLTKSEFLILLTLASSPNRVYSRQQIASAIRTNSEYVSDHSLDVHIARLRKKLGRKFCCIFCITGFGYKFDPCILMGAKKKSWAKKSPPGRPPKNRS